MLIRRHKIRIEIEQRTFRLEQTFQAEQGASASDHTGTATEPPPETTSPDGANAPRAFIDPSEKT